MVWRLLWLELFAGGADDGQARRPQPRAARLCRIHERLSSVQGRRQISASLAHHRRQDRRAGQDGGRQTLHPHHVWRQGLVRLQARQIPLQLPGNLSPLHEAQRPRPLRGDRLVRLPGRQESRLSGEGVARRPGARSEEHTSELQSLRHLVCRLLLEKKKNRKIKIIYNKKKKKNTIKKI